MKRIFYIVIALSGLIAVSCNKQNAQDRFVIEKTEYAADYDGGSVSVVINTNLSWIAVPQDSYDWLEPSKLSGNGTGDIHFNIVKNTGDTRTAVYVITAGAFAPDTVTISQEAAKSDIKFGTPFFTDMPFKSYEGIKVNIPYTEALGIEKVDFNFTFSGIAKGELTTATAKCTEFQAGNGIAVVTVPVTPTVLGPLTIVTNVYGEDLEAATVRVCEKPAYNKYVYWNYWAIGYTRSDFNTMRGSKYDLSYTSQALNPTTSGVGEDHKALVSSTSLEGCENAYLSIHCANSIVAAGDDGGKPTGTPTGLAGYQFNPGMQIQGLVKDDYIFVYIPKVSVAAGGNITIESSLGGANAAACYFLVQYSTDGKTWTTFDGAKSIEVGGETYQYHYYYLGANSGMRYLYAHDPSDPAYAKYTTKVASAINGPLYVRYLAVGLNGKSAVQTGTGWSEVKFVELAFD